MSRRKLTIQQQRIAKERQQSHLADATENDHQHQGLVIRQFGTEAEVFSDKNNIIRCQLRQNLGQLVPGDKVIWQPNENQTGVIVAKKPRKNKLTRPGHNNKTRIIAANIDAIIILIATSPNFNTILIERYLTGVLVAGFSPILVFNKIDRLTNEERKHIEELQKYYESLAYPTHNISCITQEGIPTLIKALNQQTIILIGQSGAGKSTLVQEIIPGLNLATQEISQQSGLGQHTTTTASMHPIPSGGYIIDTPGFRDFSLKHLTPQQIAQTFKEFSQYAPHCRFHNCLHVEEPNCAVREAVENNKVPYQRWQNYQKILKNTK